MISPDHPSLYRQLIGGLYDALFVTDPNGHLIEWNPRATEYFQYEKEEVLDKPASFLIPGISPKMIARIHRGLNESRHVVLDAQCDRKDGTHFPAEISISIIDLVNVGDLVFVVRNVERRRKQSELMRSKVNALQCAQCACFVCGEDRLLKSANTAFLEMFGLANEDDAVGKPFGAFFPDAPLSEAFGRALAGEKVNCTLSATDDANATVEIDVQLAPDRQGKNRILGVVGSAQRVQ